MAILGLSLGLACAFFVLDLGVLKPFGQARVFVIDLVLLALLVSFFAPGIIALLLLSRGSMMVSSKKTKSAKGVRFQFLALALPLFVMSGLSLGLSALISSESYAKVSSAERANVLKQQNRQRKKENSCRWNNIVQTAEMYV